MAQSVLYAAAPVGTDGVNTLLAFVQFSSFAEALERRTSARGPSKLSSDRGAGAGLWARPPPRPRPVDIGIAP